MKILKKKTEKLTNRKGITLIALVITIIVLLILAGVTISALSGDNGILTKAQEASENTKQANVEEKVKLAVQASYIEDGKINLEGLNNELKKIEGLTYNGSKISDTNKIISLPDTVNVDGYDVTINENGSTSVVDNTGTTVEGVIVPEGFYYVGGSKSEGIVISDNQEDANKGTSWEIAKTLKGNQFVWVPVENDEDFQRFEGYRNGNIDSKLNSCEEPYTKGYTNEVVEYNAMKDSVLKHKGFYVGRYEAGTTNIEERTSTSGIEEGVVIKQGANVYNWIGWSNSKDMTVEAGGAVQKAKEFASENNYTSVTSTLIYGVQWDTILAWIEPRYKEGEAKSEELIAENNFVANSTEKGNYTGNLTTTGSNADYAVKNIYDLAGNVYEWTMEYCNTNLRVPRGGSYNSTGSKSPVSSRGNGDSSYRDGYIGFRITLYL